MRKETGLTFREAEKDGAARRHASKRVRRRWNRRASANRRIRSGSLSAGDLIIIGPSQRCAVYGPSQPNQRRTVVSHLGSGPLLLSYIKTSLGVCLRIFRGHPRAEGQERAILIAAAGATQSTRQPSAIMSYRRELLPRVIF